MGGAEHLPTIEEWLTFIESDAEWDSNGINLWELSDFPRVVGPELRRRALQFLDVVRMRLAKRCPEDEGWISYVDFHLPESTAPIWNEEFWNQISVSAGGHIDITITDPMLDPLYRLESHYYSIPIEETAFQQYSAIFMSYRTKPNTYDPEPSKLYINRLYLFEEPRLF